jgi:hypothetical protein
MRALKVVVQMGKKLKILEINDDQANAKRWPKKFENSFVVGVSKLQKEYRKDTNYTQFKQHIHSPCLSQPRMVK